MATVVKTSLKVNLGPFQLYRIYLDQLNLLNVGDFSLSWILKDFNQLQKRKFVNHRMFTSSIKHGIRWFHVLAVQWTPNCNVSKSVIWRAVVLLKKQPIVFLTLSLSSLSWLLKLPNNQGWTLAVPSGPQQWCLNLAPQRDHKILTFSWKSYYRHPGFHSFRALGRTSIFLRAHSLE